MFKCAQCEMPLNNMSVLYWFDEKWYIKGSTKQLPFCGCACGTKYYNENGFNKKIPLKVK